MMGQHSQVWGFGRILDDLQQMSIHQRKEYIHEPHLYDRRSNQDNSPKLKLPLQSLL